MSKNNTNGNGSLFFDEKRKKWRLQISYTTPSGEIKRKSFSGNSKTEVRNKKKQFERELALGRITDASNCTAVDLLKESADYDYKIGEIKEAAYTRRIYTIKILEQSSIGSIPITNLSEVRINDFLLSLKSKYSNSVINKVYSALSTAYKLAVNKRILTYNLMDSPFIKKPKADRQDKKIHAFTCEEQNIFLEALKKKRYRAKNIDYNSMFLIELFSGLRMGEICALTPADIDFDNQVIHVRNTITRGLDYKATVGSRTKTPKGVRDVPINNYLVDVLKKVLENYVDNADNLLFYNERMNRPVSTQQTNDYFHRLCKSAGLQTTGGQHTLRHTFATRCIEADIPPEVIMTWLGHTDISITINTYCDVFAKRQNKAIDMFSAYCNENLIA
ncbi:tyrosine-type recombinase/integrase [Thomasclavelia cocleata]|uniref:tyrosine-type recombinase/integrase n=1 Tax=Thomasclavelia cocleata TaxID=69824 RepID=UPI00255ABCAC|nr:site-specific integrase [Thomasclavelia cocleata]